MGIPDQSPFKGEWTEGKCGSIANWKERDPKERKKDKGKFKT